MGERRDNPSRERQLRRRVTRLSRQSRQGEKIAQNRASQLAVVSHEMREPLNGIIGMTRLLRDTKLDEDQAGHVDGILTSALTLLDLVNDLLDISRIDAGALDLLDMTFQPAHLVRGILAMLQPRALMQGVGFEVKLADDMPSHLRADPGRLRQIILNLAANALKFTSQGEVRVLIGLQAEEGGQSGLLSIDVLDTGIGIDADAQARLGQAFQQGDASIGQIYGGSGLGLVITRRLLQAMEGDLSWEARPEGGMHFSATCKVAIPAAIPGTDAAASLEGLSLLIVDRQDEIRLTTLGLAKLWGMVVRGAHNGSEALHLMDEAAHRGRPFDLLITEAPLSDMPAQEFVRRLKAAPHLASTRLIVQTAGGMRGDAARAKELGFAAYLPKPVSGDLLCACLQQTMAADETDPSLITVHGLAESRPSFSVLVVDDNPVNRSLASIILERAGHRVQLAEDGKAALAAAADGRFDAILMDIQMPGMDGLDAARRIRLLGHEQAQSVPIVALTANASSDAGRLCKEAGMDDYVTKPIDGARLVAIIERVAREGRQSS